MSDELQGYEQSNYVRAINAAASIVAQADTSELGAKDVAENVLELAKYLAVGQDKYFKKAGFEAGKAYPSSSSGRSKSSGKPSGGSNGLTPKQTASLKKAFKSMEEDGKDAPYTMEEIEELSGKERSDAIGEVFSLAWD